MSTAESDEVGTELTAAAQPAPSFAQTSQWFESEPLWYKRAVFYEIHIRGFFDDNGDGSGDFRGLTEKLDYLEWLGIDCIWLLPFYESPLKDGGYDISDFNKVHPDYGNVEDVKRLVEAAHALQVVVGLGQVLADGAVALEQVGHGVEPKAVEAEVEPEAQNVEHRRLNLGVVVVEVRLMREEAVPVVLAGDRVPGPVR